LRGMTDFLYEGLSSLFLCLCLMQAQLTFYDAMAMPCDGWE
jgi:hypothetical protein